ncbi:MAG: acetylesterase [Clostridiales bacterium]|nr:acetylesterase [Clostridiales bacterium]
MAIIKTEMYSKKLERNIFFNVVLPIEASLEKGEKEKLFPTLYLLHGYSGNQNDWLEETTVSQLAEEKGIALVMPAGENKFYVDQRAVDEQYGAFIGEELVEMTRNIFPLSRRREDTLIAGLSMGGYGAMRNGLKYHEVFRGIGAFSSAFIIDSLIEDKDIEETTQELKERKRRFSEIFGDFNELKNSDKHYKALIQKLKKEKKQIPELWITCGTEDFLINENRDFYRFLQENHVPVTYIEKPGEHTWPYWQWAIEAFLQWAFQ